MNMKKIFLVQVIIASFVFCNNTGFAQNIAINSTGNQPDTSAMLDVSSTIKGLLVPRMTTAQMNAIPLPAKGLLLYNTSTNLFMVNTGTSLAANWVALAAGSGGISSLGGLTGSTQTFATANSGSDFSIGSSGTTHTFNLPDASASARGVVTTGAQTFGGNKTFGGLCTFVNSTGNQNVLSIRSSANDGWTSIDCFDNNNVMSATYGYANPGVSTVVFRDRAYINSYGNDLLITVNSSTGSILVNGTSGNVGIGNKDQTGTNNSTLEVNGAFATKLNKITANTTTTLDNNSSVYYITGSGSITLPSASTCANRRYVIVNRTNASKTISSFTNLSGTSTTSIGANSAVEIIADGSNWLQIR
jgi:hypothetical protein